MSEDLGRIQARQTGKGEPRYWLDFRKEVRRLGLPERVGRIHSIPSDVGVLVIDNRQLAQRALEHIRVRLCQGEPLAAVLDSFRPFGASHVLRCADRFLEYQRERARAGQISMRSVDIIESHVRNHWSAKWKGVCVTEIRSGHLEDWAVELQSHGLGADTVRTVLANMRSMMRWLKRRQELHEVPDFPKITVPERSPRLLTIDQQTAVLEAIPVVQRGIFLAMADLWLRPSEARALRPEVYEVVQDRGPEDPAGWMTIKRAADDRHSNASIREWTKTRRVRHLPVSDRLANWIACHVPMDARLTQELLFPSTRGVMYSHAGLQSSWRRASKSAGVPIVPVREGTRHTSATYARREKWPLDLIQRFLGHTNVKTTERYSRHHDGALVQLIRR